MPPRAVPAVPPAFEPALPDYAGGSLANLMASILGAFGASSPYPELRRLPAAELAAARHVVLLLVDGLGYHYLARHAAPRGALRRHLRASMTSVFPSTTATAITTVHTGLAPQQHGLVGWFTHLEEAGGAAAVLPFRRRADGASLAAAGVDPARLFAGPPIFDRMDAETWVVSPRDIIESDYNRAHCGGARRVAYATLEEMFRCTTAAVRDSRGRAYVYAYTPEFDSLAGTGTAVVVTADHGFIDTVPERRLDLADYPALAELLDAPLTGEPRVAFCRTGPGQAAEFARRASELLAGAARAWPSRQLLDKGWFGSGDPHPRLAARIGDVTLVMERDYVLRDWLPGERRYVQVGVHGGVSEDEMRIPLVVIET
jgi:hypothetical protein